MAVRVIIEGGFARLPKSEDEAIDAELMDFTEKQVAKLMEGESIAVECF